VDKAVAEKKRKKSNGDGEYLEQIQQVGTTNFREREKGGVHPRRLQMGGRGRGTMIHHAWPLQYQGKEEGGFANATVV